MITTKVFSEWKQSGYSHSSGDENREKRLLHKQDRRCVYCFPVEDPWAPVRQVAGAFPADFMIERDQPCLSEKDEREDF